MDTGLIFPDFMSCDERTGSSIDGALLDLRQWREGVFQENPECISPSATEIDGFALINYLKQALKKSL